MQCRKSSIVEDKSTFGWENTDSYNADRILNIENDLKNWIRIFSK